MEAVLPFNEARYGQRRFSFLVKQPAAAALNPERRLLRGIALQSSVQLRPPQASLTATPAR